jgi:hypothetical protein
MGSCESQKKQVEENEHGNQCFEENGVASSAMVVGLVKSDHKES